MKYTLFFAALLVIITAGCVTFDAGRADSQAQTAGQSEGQEVHEGMAQGYRGPIHVRVRINAGSITEINVLDSSEDRFVGEAAIEELIDTIIEFNSTDVDAVTGATVTSKGFLEAVNNAIMGL